MSNVETCLQRGNFCGDRMGILRWESNVTGAIGMNNESRAKLQYTIHDASSRMRTGGSDYLWGLGGLVNDE